MSAGLRMSTGFKVRSRPGQGGLRCDLAADVARELVSIAALRESDARAELIRAAVPSEERERYAGDLYAEANALRSLAYAINKHNVQP